MSAAEPVPSVLLPWIDALARKAAQDYLRSEAVLQAEAAACSTKPVPLRDMDKAA